MKEKKLKLALCSLSNPIVFGVSRQAVLWSLQEKIGPVFVLLHGLTLALFTHPPFHPSIHSFWPRSNAVGCIHNNSI